MMQYCSLVLILSFVPIKTFSDSISESLSDEAPKQDIDVLYQVRKILLRQSITWNMTSSSNYSSKCLGREVKPKQFILSFNNYSNYESERFETQRRAAAETYKNKLALQLDDLFLKNEINLLYLVGDERRSSLLLKISEAYSRCSVVSKIYLNYYGSLQIQFEKDISQHSIKKKIVFIPSSRGLGHRFHFFNDSSINGLDLNDTFVINLDDDMVVSCESIKDILFTANASRYYEPIASDQFLKGNHRQLHKSSSILYQNKQVKKPLKPNGNKNSSGQYYYNYTRSSVLSDHFYSIIDLKLVRNVALYQDCLQYSWNREKNGIIGLTSAAIIPRLMMEYAIKIVPESVFRKIDFMKNCEDILLNFVSAFLNNDTGVSAFIETANEITSRTQLSLSKSNGKNRRAWCVHWISYIFSPFQVFPKFIKKKMMRHHDTEKNMN